MSAGLADNERLDKGILLANQQVMTGPFHRNASVALLALNAWIPWAGISLDPSGYRDMAARSSLQLRVGSQDCSQGSVFLAAVASTPESRAHGLSQRLAPLGDREAMAFLFDAPASDSFWMKETYIPLSIGFFDDQGKLIASYEMPVENDPENPVALYHPAQPYRAAIEAAPGTFSALDPGRAYYLCVGTG